VGEEIPTRDVIRFISERMADMTNIYKVLNESHTDTQIRLERIATQFDGLKETVAEDHDKLESLSNEFSTFMTQTKTVFKIVTYFMTPALAVSLLIQVAQWLAQVR